MEPPIPMATENPPQTINKPPSSSSIMKSSSLSASPPSATLPTGEAIAECHGDYTTVNLKKNSPHGEIIITAHLGLPGGSVARIFKCSFFKFLLIIVLILSL